MNVNNILLTLAIILILSAIVIICNVMARKRDEKDRVKIISKYPLTPSESYIGDIDDPFYRVFDIESKKADIDIENAIMIIEYEKCQKILSLVEAIANIKNNAIAYRNIDPDKLNKVISKEFGNRMGTPYLDSFIEGYRDIPKEHLEDFKDPDIPVPFVANPEAIKGFVKDEETKIVGQRNFHEDGTHEDKMTELRKSPEQIDDDVTWNQLKKNSLDNDYFKRVKQDTPEDYLSQFVFENGKWIHKPSK